MGIRLRWKSSEQEAYKFEIWGTTSKAQQGCHRCEWQLKGEPNLSGKEEPEKSQVEG